MAHNPHGLNEASGIRNFMSSRRLSRSLGFNLLFNHRFNVEKGQRRCAGKPFGSDNPAMFTIHIHTRSQNKGAMQ